MGEPVVIDGDNLPSPVRIGLTDLQNIGGASGPPGPPGSGTTASEYILHEILMTNQKRHPKQNRISGTHLVFTF